MISELKTLKENGIWDKIDATESREKLKKVANNFVAALLKLHGKANNEWLQKLPLYILNVWTKNCGEHTLTRSLCSKEFLWANPKTVKPLEMAIVVCDKSIHGH